MPPNSGSSRTTDHLDLLTHDREGTLIRNIGEFPRVLKTAAAHREPHRIAVIWKTWPETTTASTTPAACCLRAMKQPNELHTARLALCQATRQVIANGLGILGVTAPERM